MPIQSHGLKDFESLAQSVSRAIVPLRSLRGPAVQLSRGNACSIGFSFDDGDVHPGEQLGAIATAAALRPARLAIRRKIRFTCSS